MSTRSQIGIVNKDGSVRSIYCHFDGYLDYNGELLQKHYRTTRKINQLINHGSVSSLGVHIGRKHDFEDRGHNFEDNFNKHCTFYIRDRDEDPEYSPIVEDKSEKEYWKGFRNEYSYVYLWKKGKWYCNGELLSELLEKELETA